MGGPRDRSRCLAPGPHHLCVDRTTNWRSLTVPWYDSPVTSRPFSVGTLTLRSPGRPGRTAAVWGVWRRVVTGVRRPTDEDKRDASVVCHHFFGPRTVVGNGAEGPSYCTTLVSDWTLQCTTTGSHTTTRPLPYPRRGVRLRPWERTWGGSYVYFLQQ